jgi:hypothetical protein
METLTITILTFPTLHVSVDEILVLWNIYFCSREHFK